MSASTELHAHAKHLPDRVEQENTIQFSEILAYLFEGKWTIASIAGVVFLYAVFKAYQVVPIYHTEAMLQIVSGGDDIPGLAVSQSIGRSNSNEAVTEIIKSRRIIGDAVRELGLIYHVRPRYYPYIGSTMAARYHGKELAIPFLGLDEYAWGGEVLTLDRFDISGALAETSSSWQLITEKNQDYTLNDNGKKVLSGKVGETVVADYQGSKIELHISQLSAHPGVMFTISRSSTIGAIQSLSGGITVTESGESYRKNGIVTISMSGTDPKDIVRKVNAVAEAYVRNKREQQSQKAEQKLKFIDGQIPSLKEKQDKAALELQKFQREAGSINITLEIENTLTQLEELKDEASAYQLEKEELQEKFTDEHPTLKTLFRKIELVEKNREKLEKQLRELPEKEWIFLQKSRDVAASTELYMNMLNTAQELRIAKAGMLGNVQIIDPAVVQPWSVSSGKSRILLIGLISGLLLGIVWVLLKRMMHTGVEDPTQIENETGLPVFATIPHSENQQKILSKISERDKGEDSSEILLLAYEYDTDMAIEAMRSFRTNMRFALKTSEDNVVIITGPSPSIGKSFFSSNLAAVSCREGQRVLLIDADMRKGRLHKNLGTANWHGLSEVIAGDITLDKAIHEVKDHFYFLSCGKRPPNPAELLETEAFHRMLEEANQTFDMVIIDTPPILAVTDASIIAQYGGKLFMLLRSGEHKMKEILAATSTIEKSGVKVTGLLLNDQKVTAAGYGYTYQYDYK